IKPRRGGRLLDLSRPLPVTRQPWTALPKRPLRNERWFPLDEVGPGEEDCREEYHQDEDPSDDPRGGGRGGQQERCDPGDTEGEGGHPDRGEGATGSAGDPAGLVRQPEQECEHDRAPRE